MPHNVLCIPYNIDISSFRKRYQKQNTKFETRIVKIAQRIYQKRKKVTRKKAWYCATARECYI